MQVAVVDAHQRRVQGLQCTFQLGAVMHFDQYVETDRLGSRRQFGHQHVVQRRDDQQDAVGTDRPRLDDLVRIDHEVLADHRQRTGGPRFLQIGIGALEEVHVGEHRQARRATRLVAAGDLRRDEVFAQHALARRCLLDLGDHCRLLALGPLQQGIGEAARRIGATRQPLDLGQVDARSALGDLLGLAGEDLLQNRRHTHCAFSSL